MHRHDGARLRGDRGFDFAYIDVAGAGIGIHEHRGGAGQPDGFRRGKKCVGSGDDLVARAEAERQKHQPQRVGAGVYAHGFLRVQVARQFFLELDQLRAQHIAAALQHLEDGLINFSLQVVVLLHVAIKADIRFRH